MEFQAAYQLVLLGNKNMEKNEFTDKRCNLANHFEQVFQRLLSGEKLDLYEEDVSVMFEVIAAHLLAGMPDRKYCWYDGVVGLEARVRKIRQVVFSGEMWVGDDKTQWKENFQATVTDKRLTKQGISIMLLVGSHQAEGELSTAFGLSE